MSNIDKRAVQAVADLKAGYTLGQADVEIIQKMALDAVTLLDELEAAEKRIAELEARQVLLPPKAPDNLASCLDGYEKWLIATTFRDTWNACLAEVVRVNAAAGKGE